VNEVPQNPHRGAGGKWRCRYDVRQAARQNWNCPPLRLLYLHRGFSETRKSSVQNEQAQWFSWLHRASMISNTLFSK